MKAPCYKSVVLRHTLKYLVILTLAVVLVIPTILVSFNLAKNSIIDSARNKLNDDLRRLDSEIVQSQKNFNTLSMQPNYMRIHITKGDLATEDYVVMKELHQTLSNLSQSQKYLIDSYLVFRDNPVLITSKLCYDDGYYMYNKMFGYTQMSYDQWRESIRMRDDFVTLEPVKGFYSGSVNEMPENGIACIFQTPSFQNSYITSQLVSVFSCDKIEADFLSSKFGAESMLYLTDRRGDIVYQHNYNENTPIESISDNSQYSSNEETYVVIQSDYPSRYIYATLGIPNGIFLSMLYRIVRQSVIMVLIGICLLILVSIFMSAREMSQFSNLMKSTAEHVLPDISYKNEYDYMKLIASRFDDINSDQLYRINSLNSSVKYFLMQNMLTSPIHTQQEEERILNFLNGDFEFYCVIIMRYSNDRGNYQNSTLFADIEKSVYQITGQKTLSVSFSSNETVLLLDLPAENQAHLRTLQKQALEWLDTMNLEENERVHIGISHIGCGVKNAYVLYQQALECINFNSNEKVSTVNLYTLPSGRKKPVLDTGVPAKFQNTLVSGNLQELDEMFVKIKEIAASSVFEAVDRQQLFFSLRQPIYNVCLEIRENISEAMFTEWSEALNYNPNLSTVEIIDQLYNAAHQISIQLNEMKRHNNTRLENQVVEYVQTHFQDMRLTASHISEELMISEKYVFTLIKNATGKSLSKYVEEVRINHAEKLLLTTSESNARIAEMSGFGSDKTFYRAFSRKHNLSPSEWKKLEENKNISREMNDCGK